MASSSDSDNDEERRKLAQALDPDFLRSSQNSSLKNGNASGASGSSNGVKVPERDLPPSVRAKIFNDNPEQNEFTKIYSLDVTPASQKFIAKQLAKSLEKSLKEVTPPPPEAVQMDDPDFGIKLFATSTSKVTERDLEVKQITRRPRPKPKSKSTRKRKRDDDGSTDSSESENERLKSVAVTADWVIKQ